MLLGGPVLFVVALLLTLSAVIVLCG